MSFLDSIFGGLLNGGEPDDLGCDWYCDGCRVHMNGQPGFAVSSGVWTCTKCGFANDVTSDNIKKRDERPVTEAQLRYIKKIEELLGVTFDGKTLEEASDFIGYYKDRYQAKLHTPYKYR